MEALHDKLGPGAVVIAIHLMSAIGVWGVLRAARQGRPVNDPWGGPLLFRHGALVRGISLFLASVVPLAILIAFVLLPKKEGEEIMAASAFALFAALGLSSWWEASRFAVLLSPTGLDCRSPWRGEQFFAWDEIDRISYRSRYWWFLIEATGGRTFRVPVVVAGISEFLANCEQHLPPTAFARAEEGYIRVGRPFHGRTDGFTPVGLENTGDREFEYRPPWQGVLVPIVVSLLAAVGFAYGAMTNDQGAVILGVAFSPAGVARLCWMACGIGAVLFLGAIRMTMAGLRRRWRISVTQTALTLPKPPRFDEDEVIPYEDIDRLWSYRMHGHRFLGIRHKGKTHQIAEAWLPDRGAFDEIASELRARARAF